MLFWGGGGKGEITAFAALVREAFSRKRGKNGGVVDAEGKRRYVEIEANLTHSAEGKEGSLFITPGGMEFTNF